MSKQQKEQNYDEGKIKASAYVSTTDSTECFVAGYLDGREPD